MARKGWDKLEFKFVALNRQQVTDRLNENSVDKELVLAAREIKRAAAQIDVVLHALGILVLLPSILEEGEMVEALFLGGDDWEPAAEVPSEVEGSHRKRKRLPTFLLIAFCFYAGDDLRSHTLSRAVPSALRGLTSVFGMGTGGSPAVRSPTKSIARKRAKLLALSL